MRGLAGVPIETTSLQENKDQGRNGMPQVISCRTLWVGRDLSIAHDVVVVAGEPAQDGGARGVVSPELSEKAWKSGAHRG